MSIKRIKGNLLDFPEGCNVIAHCCNAQGVMGSGIAKSIKDEYPNAYEVYKEAYDEVINAGAQSLPLGHVSVGTNASGKKIVNCVAQEFYGKHMEGDVMKRYVDYEAFYSCFATIKDKLEKAIEDGKKPVLGVPYKIASDRAGGDWRVIEAMLTALFETSPVPLLIVEYTK